MWFVRRIISLNRVLLFESGVNHPIQIRSSNPILKCLLFLSEVCGKLFFNSLTRKFYQNEVNERIVEIPFVFRNLSCSLGTNILDFGCNRSFLSIELASLGYNVTGVDLLPYFYKHSNFEFRQGNLLEMGLAAEHFSAIIAVSSIEHAGLGFYGDAIKKEADLDVMKELYRVLQPGGKVIITVPFGRARRDDFTRIYDKDTLMKLTSIFRVVHEEYYFKKAEENEWIPAEQSLGIINALSAPLADCVACLVCRKD